MDREDKKSFSVPEPDGTNPVRTEGWKRENRLLQQKMFAAILEEKKKIIIPVRRAAKV